MGIIQLANNSFSVNEAGGVAKVTVLRLGNKNNRTTIKYSTLPGTAQNFQDYMGILNGQIVFNPGDSIKTISVPIINDQIFEVDETFAVAIGEAVTNYLEPGQKPDDLGSIRTATVTIKDNDISAGSTVGFNVSNFTVQENQGVAVVTITKKITNTSATVDFRTQDDFAKSVTTRPEFRDYTRLSQRLTFAPQQTIKTVTIPIINDNLPEGNETLDLILSNPVGTTLGLRNNATLTIVDNDPLPQGFTKEVVVTGLTKPSGFAWAPNGNMYITEVDGIVKVFDQKTKTLLPTPFINMTNKVNNRGQRGLLSFTIDPQFPTKPYLYLGYTYDSPQQIATDGPDGANLRTNRLVRITADAKTNYTTALPNSEVVLMEVPNGANFHASAGLSFGKDGSLFWGHGDGAVVASIIVNPAKFNDLNYPFGKLFRINPITGKGYSNNPFFDGNPDTYRSKVYSYGLRNPFRIAINPKNGEPYIGDVGWNNWEEINTGRGKNFGWPLYEGANGRNVRTSAYANDPNLQAVYNQNQNITPSIYAINHQSGFASLTLGSFYNSNVYPSIFRDSLFYADFNSGLVQALNFDTTGTKVENSLRFDKTSGFYPTQLSLGPDGNLYAANYQFFGQGTASIIRWVYKGQTQPAITVNDSSVLEGNSGLRFADFVIRLSHPSSTPVKVTAATTNVTATTNVDYYPVNQIVTFAPNVTIATIKVGIQSEQIFEPNETFRLQLSNPTGATIAKAQGQGFIMNDDLKPKIFVSNVTVTEGNAGNKNVGFVIRLSNSSFQNISILASTSNRSAVAPTDYLSKTEFLSFAPGQTTKTFNVQVRGDTTKESNEMFKVNLTNLINVDPGNLSAFGTIVNDDITKSIALLGSRKSFTLGGSTEKFKSPVILSTDRSLNSVNLEKVFIEGLTQSHEFVANVNAANLAI